MVITTADFVYKQMLDINAIYFTVKSDDSRGYLGRQMDMIPSLDAVEKLRDVLDSVQTGGVVVKISIRPFDEVQKSGDKYAGIFTYTIRINNAIKRPEQQNISANLGASVPLVQYLESVQRANELNLELHLLRVKMDSKENSSSDNWRELLTPVISEFAKNPKGTIASIGSLFRAPVPVQISKVEQSGEPWTPNEKIASAMAMLKSIDSDAENLLLDMATALQKHPEILPAFKENIRLGLL